MDRSYYRIPVSSFQDLQNKINSFSLLESETRLFRGQSRASWNLESGLFRSLRDKGQIKNFYQQEEIELESFFKNARFSTWTEHSPIQKLSIAQHYQARTRLLDWSESWEIALWFAFYDNEERKERALYSIFIDPWDIFPEEYQEFPDYCLVRFINPQKFLSNPRIQNQRGWFSTQAARIIPPDKVRSGDGIPQFDKMGLIEEDPHFNFKITKFILPDFIRDEVLTYLKEKGINDNFIFPDN
ncbi:FRG domain-containing protein [Aquiflexum sp.]|uniref:FRG domain-containing protein n=1 Tax=Aquiflexum sp. TaxID=1872584 RepID=UPI003593DC26